MLPAKEVYLEFMFDINLFEFSREYCLGICAFLVPANLLLTSRTLWLVAHSEPRVRIQRSAILAIIATSVLLLHDYSWFTIKVVMAPTYILLFIAFLCSGLNISVIVYPTGSRQLLKLLFSILSSLKVGILSMY